MKRQNFLASDIFADLFRKPKSTKELEFRQRDSHFGLVIVVRVVLGVIRVEDFGLSLDFSFKSKELYLLDKKEPEKLFK